MLFELIAAFSIGAGAAGLVMLVNWALGGVLPRFAVPVAAGLAMIGFGVWSEYSWFDRQRANLGDGFAVVYRHSAPSPLRPWTYLHPFVSRFSAVDTAGAQRNPNVPGQVMSQILLMERYSPTTSVPLIVDCRGNRHAYLVDGVGLDAAGRVEGADWRALDDQDPLRAALCPAA